MLKRLLSQSGIYSLGKLFSFLAALISYPILTKNLSISEYGSVAILTVTIGLMTSFMKLGIQHSIIRFHSEIKYSIFITNIISLLSTTLLISSIFVLTTLIILGLFFDHLILDTKITFILIFSAIFQAIHSYVSNLFIAKEKSKIVTSLSILYRLVTLTCMAIAIILIEASTYSFILALLVADSIYITGLYFWLKKNNHINKYSTKLIDKKIIKTMLLFGAPMLGYELANMVHAFVDRFMIEYFMNSQAVGLYSASYNMASLVGNILMGGIATAIVPVYLDIWKNEGKEATEKLLTNVNSLFLITVPPVISGLYSISAPLLGVLATDAYKETSYIIPIAATGVILFTSSVIYAAGLMIKKSTKELFRYVLESTIINICLNYLFIPEFGLLAAALNTVVSYLWMAFRFYIKSNKIIQIKFNILLLLRSITYSAIMWYCLNYINSQSDIYNLLLKSVSGVLIYSLLLYIFEKKYRIAAIKLLSQWLETRRNSNG